MNQSISRIGSLFQPKESRDSSLNDRRDDSSDISGSENVEYCEDDEAKLHPSDNINTMENLQSLPYLDIL